LHRLPEPFYPLPMPLSLIPLLAPNAPGPFGALTHDFRLNP
jgi:hypothetical protein